MSENHTEKHLKTYDEAFLELRNFIRKTKLEEAQQKEEASVKEETHQN